MTTKTVSSIKLNVLLLVVLSLSFFSCTQNKKVVNIQTLRPSELTIPKDFSQPIVVASIYKGIEGDRESMAQAALDSTAAMEAAIVLAESLYDSPWFQGLKIPVRSNYRDDSSRLILPFKWSKVEEICAKDNADLLISLEYIKITPSSDSYSYWDGVTNAYYGYLSMNIYAYWRVYDLNRKKVVADYLYRDTITWEDYDYINVRVGDQLPGFFSASSYSGYVVGSEYAKLIAPSWMDEQRIYFGGGSKEMRAAAELASQNDWLGAAGYWQQVLNNQKVKPEIAAKAAFNMAVANEMVGNFDVALEWLNKSAEYYSILELPTYRKLLELRIKLLEKL
ncbi:MAG: hypothetical protein CVT98_05600 [Bacteroidetes bacterium HGW-Bacteroidetes-15]|nr:MAG: hypothetical protein CVT98_05600 [Bacteroidetes bacterium HGW-Bacteroidetes-15]